MSWYRCNCFYTNNYFIKLKSGHSAHLTYHHPDTTRMRQENFYQLRNKLKIGSITELPVVIDQLNLEYKRRKDLDSELENAQNSIPKSLKQSSMIPSNFNETPEMQITEISKNIYRVGPIFKNLPAIKNHLKSFSSHCKSNNLPFAKPNSMNKYGVLLPKQVFNTDQLTEFFKKLFCENRFDFKLDSQRVFTVEYGTGKDSDLDLHFDDSELTANICLENEDENDGKLFFQKRVENGEIVEDAIFDQIENYAIVHEGKLVHSAESSFKNRMNLIVWMRDSEVRKKLCRMCGKVPELSDEPGFEYAGGFKK